MRYGFTGPERGIRPEQLRTIELLLRIGQAGTGDVLVHGGCVGGDTQVHELAETIGYDTEVHPSNLPHKQGVLGGTVRFEERDPLERNPTIVERCTILLAAPGEFEEVIRSGTWHTIRAAGKAGRTTLIVWPDGTIEPRHGGLR